MANVVNAPAKYLGPTTFGDTCPYLNIAKAFDLDYGDVLAVADYHTHGRDLLLVEVIRTISQSLDNYGYERFIKAMTRQASRYRELRAGAPPQHSAPVPA